MTTESQQRPHKSGQTSGASARAQLCVFTLAGEKHGLATLVLQEVVRDLVVEPIPMTGSAVLGVFNLRGTPTILLDAKTLLGKPSTEDSSRATALVLRDEDLRVAIAVDRVDGVVEIASDTLLQAPTARADYCDGFVELPGQTGLVAILSTARLLEGIHALQFTKREQRIIDTLEHE
jgi:chemotaxis signal transduction protein